MKTLVALVGMKHRGTMNLVASLPNGEPLVLKREPDNKFDANAVQVWARGQHVGYIKGSQNTPIALAMDRAPRPMGLGIPAEKEAKLAIDGGHWPMVEIET